jgi:hypothetical protein
MSEQHRVPPNERSSNASLEQVYGDLLPVRKAFSLLPNYGYPESNLYEYISDKTRRHIITFTDEGGIRPQHRALHRAGVDVLDGAMYDRTAVLEVPHGTKSLRSVANLVERDPDHYAVIFRILGNELRKINDADIGAPSGIWLDQFAYAPDSHSDYGARVVFLPPYNLAENPNNDISTKIGSELLQTGTVTEPTVQKILWEVRNGWS